MSSAGKHAAIVAANLGLTTGETAKNGVCPSCGGGTSRKRTFSVTREAMGLVYICFRASCGSKGFVPDIPGSIDSELLHAQRKQKTALRPYVGDLLPANMTDAAYFLHRFGLRHETVHACIKVNSEDSYVLPIFSSSLWEAGYVVREPTWKGNPEPPRAGRDDRPKARTFMHADVPLLSWYFGENPDAVVLVEDQISAMKVAQNDITCAALLGTNLTNDKVMDIAQQQPKQVLLALDEDATETAFRLASKWQMAFDDMRVVILERDLKYTDNLDITQVLGI